MGLRRAIIETCRRMNAMGLNQGTSGNIGVRFGDGYLLAPSGMAYERLVPDDIVELDFGDRYRGDRVPSTEWRLHRDILRHRSDIDVVIHAHPMFCTTLAIHGLDIPAVHYMVAASGGARIPCVPYRTPTTAALADSVVAALQDVRACLMAHHGVVVIGETLDSTLGLLVEVENLAAHYWRALQIGDPPVLGDDDMDEILEIMGMYGKQPDPELRRAD